MIREMIRTNLKAQILIQMMGMIAATIAMVAMMTTTIVRMIMTTIVVHHDVILRLDQK